MQLVINRICAVTVFLLFICHANGQIIYDTLLLDELEILAMKADYSSSVKTSTIDSLIKQDLDHLDLGELLASYTPIFVKSYGRGGLATASFRGTSASHTQVLWNDFRINSPMLGQVDLSLIPNSYFDDIELFFGGASLKSTGGALGGSVNLNNSNGFGITPLINFEQAVGSFHSYATNASLNLHNAKFSSVTRFDYQSSKNDFDYYNNALLPAERMDQENADFRNVGFTQQFSYKITPKQLISFTTWNQWNMRNIPAIMTNVESGGNREEYQKDYFSRNILSWTYHQNRSLFEVKAAWFFEDQQYYLKTTTNDDSAHIVTEIDSKNKTNKFAIKTKYDRTFNNGFDFTAGLDVDMERVQTNNYEESEGRNVLSLYGMLNKRFFKRLKISFLLRAEYADDKMLPLMPLFGINYKLLNSEDFYLRASVSRNYHLPTLNDLYWYPGGNSDLKPEDGFEIEGGLNYVKKLESNIVVRADLSVYASRISDWIQWLPTDYRFWSPENISEVFARGVEISAHLDGKSGIFSYKIFAEYAYTHTTDESDIKQERGSSGQQLIYIPENIVNGFIYGSVKGYYLSWTVNYVGKRNTTSDPEKSYSDILPAYVLNDLSVGKRWFFKKTGLEARFKVNNIFNVDYQAILWRAMPGRNYEIILKFNIN